MAGKRAGSRMTGAVKPNVTGESTSEERRNSARVFRIARISSRTAAVSANDEIEEEDWRNWRSFRRPSARIANRTAIPARIATPRIQTMSSKLGKFQCEAAG